MMHHFLLDAFHPFIESNIKHIRNVSNSICQRIDRINELIFLKMNLLSIPTYFENKESSFICYKYNKHICSAILNFSK